MLAMRSVTALSARLVLAAGLAAACGAAQQSRIISTVVDERTAETITDLPADRFLVKDGTTELRVLAAQQPATPVDIIALVDSSIVGDLVRPLAEALVTELGGGGQMALAQFDEGATLLQDFTSDKNLLHRALASIEYGNLPRLNDALYAVVDGGFGRGSNRKAIIALSGGVTAASRTPEGDVLQAARYASVSIYTVFARNDARGYLRRLALRTGGAPFAARRLRLQPRELAAKILKAVHHPYWLSAEGVFALGDQVSITVRQTAGSKAKLTASALPVD